MEEENSEIWATESSELTGFLHDDDDDEPDTTVAESSSAPNSTERNNTIFNQRQANFSQLWLNKQLTWFPKPSTELHKWNLI